MSKASKVDMSLDDIIKLSKSTKWNQAQTGKSRGGRGVAGRAQRGGRGRGRAIGSNRGNLSQQQTFRNVKRRGINLRGRPGRGRGRGGRGAGQNNGVSPLNRNKNNRGRGHSRGRGNINRGGILTGKQLIFTNSGVKPQSRQTIQQNQRQRLNSVQSQAALLREKQLALKNLQMAKQNMQSVNLAIQKTSRENVVNQMRGISNVQGNQPRGRGRGRLLAPLTRQTGTGPVRQLVNTSVTISNPAASSSPSPMQGGKRRKWRRNNNKAPSEHFTIQVANQNLQTVGKQSSVLDELKKLKPAVTTTYQFQKNVFATPATGVSLNDRFSGSIVGDGGDIGLDGRKVFI